MLTKEERAAIAERLKDIAVFNHCDFYRAVMGKDALAGVHYVKNESEIYNVILELCDTSNMIELPCDKDGEVIRIGDTVYDENGKEGRVGGYYHNNGNWKIIIPFGQNGCFVNVLPNELIHKKPVTIESLVERFKHVLKKGEMSYWAVGEICDIVDQLEKLRDSDD